MTQINKLAALLKERFAALYRTAFRGMDFEFEATLERETRGDAAWLLPRLGALPPDKSCPCEWEHVAACGYACSCRNSFQSGGCLRCTKYGSVEQRRAQAEHLAGALPDGGPSPAAIKAVVEIMDDDTIGEPLEKSSVHYRIMYRIAEKYLRAAYAVDRGAVSLGGDDPAGRSPSLAEAARVIRMKHFADGHTEEIITESGESPA